MKVVFDTNILISGYLFGGNCEYLIREVKNKRLLLFSSKETINELKKVLEYKKFKLTNDEIQKISSDYQNISIIIEIKERINIIKEDKSDNIFLSLALESKADCIISGDSHILALKNKFKIPVYSVSEFIELLIK